jgi:uncharacterized transporter YbjL
MIKQIVLTVVVTVTSLICLIVGAKILDFDPRLAAGLGAGGVAQWAIIGTARDAIGRRGLEPTPRRIQHESAL